MRDCYARIHVTLCAITMGYWKDVRERLGGGNPEAYKDDYAGSSELVSGGALMQLQSQTSACPLPLPLRRCPCFDPPIPRTARTAKPSLSTAANDELLACLNWPMGKWKRKTDTTHQAAPFYYDACWEWYQRLSVDQQETFPRSSRRGLCPIVRRLWRVGPRRSRPRRSVRCDGRRFSILTPTPDGRIRTRLNPIARARTVRAHRVPRCAGRAAGRHEAAHLLQSTLAKK